MYRLLIDLEKELVDSDLPPLIKMGIGKAINEIRMILDRHYN